MIPRFARIFSAGLLLLLSTQAHAQPAPSPLPEAPRPVRAAGQPTTAQPVGPNTAAQEDPMVDLVLSGADLDTVLSTLEMFTDKVLLIPGQLPTVATGYNLRIKKQIRRSQAILYIETLLAMNGIAVIPQGDKALKIVPLPQAGREAPELIIDSTLELPASNKISSKLFSLEFLRVQDIQGILAGMTIQGIVPIPSANAFVVTDTISNLQRVERLMQHVDKPVAGGMGTKFYQLRNGAKASDVVAKLSNMLRTIQPQLGTGTSYSPDDRTNQVILISDPRQFAFFDELISKLDVRADPNTRNEVIPLKNADAEELRTVLTDIVKGQTSVAQRSPSTRPAQRPSNQPTPLGTPPGAAPAPAPVVVTAPGLGGDQSGAQEFSDMLTLSADKRTNSIIVSGTLDDIRLIRDLVEKLDGVLAQVRIEVLIAEVSLTNNDESGIQALGLQVDGDRLVGFRGAVPGLLIDGGAADADTFASIIRPGTSGAWDLKGIVTLTTTPRKNNLTVLLNPTVTTSHNKEAEIFVGENRPVVTGSVTTGISGGTTSTTGYQEIGTRLTITPLIGSDGSVQLNVVQDFSTFQGNVSINGNATPSTFTRTTKSFVTVRSGEIVVLGGLQRTDTTNSRSRLGPIPIIGDLLGYRKKEKTRTDLVFFLRPHVLTNTPADNVSTMERVKQLPQRDEVFKTIDPNYQPPKKSVLDKILPK